MVKEIDLSSDSGMLYTISVAPKIAEITAPLKKHLCLHSFAYTKTLKNGSYLYLSDKPEDYLKQFFETAPSFKPFNNLFKNIPLNTLTHTSFPLLPTNPITSLSYKYGGRYVFILTKKNSDHIECFSFISSSEDSYNFFIKNLDLLKEFCSYFKITASDIINTNERSKLTTSKNKLDWISTPKPSEIKNRQAFLKELNKNKSYTLTTKLGNDVIISPRQYECLRLLSLGKNMNEVAVTLNLSSRTIETHINAIKNKIGYRNKSELVRAFIDTYYPYIKTK